MFITKFNLLNINFIVNLCRKIYCMTIFKTNQNSNLLIGLCILILCSCKKDTTSSNISLGKLSGSIQTWDDKLNSINDAQGITVTIGNLPNTNTTTDANGRFSFENLPYDEYEIVISKSGYGTKKVIGVKHASTTTTIPVIGFGKVSTTVVSSFSINGNTFNGEPGVSFNYAFSPAPTTSNRSFVRYFFSNAATVSNTNYSAFSSLRSYSSNISFAGFNNGEFAAMGFTSGQTIFVKVYGDSFQSNDYIEPNSGLRIFPNLNNTSPAAVSFVMP
jgi:hypothetical protein